ncbi:MAG: alpha/beta hydrolase-fold protein, partial [Bacteroidota bacterium]
KSEILGEEIPVTTFGSLNGSGHIVYVTDGQKWLENGFLDTIDRLLEQKKLPEHFYVLVGTIDPITNEDKRNTYFFCNEDYVKFFERELVPEVESMINGKFKASHRSLVGMSFGGLNAAYFSGRTGLFGNYGLLSPITYPCDKAISSIAFSKNRGLRIILTSGKNDAENYLPDLYNTYLSKGYDVQKLFTAGSHDFENWNGQLEDILNYLTQTP